MSEIKRKKGESFESFLRRFQNRIRESGKILQAKKIRFFRRNPNKNQRRKSALERRRRANLMTYLKKVGKLKEETLKKK